ncbi:PREDICTED: uncharacterized protein LOC105451278 [Wasmannia auropunctata]|uniref:uncharacterized protein LOC105451278 n=1 Tax=Wasmannia auropunctata TaxID=64793 RepID=UPI0005EF19CB|nr:PREDICTED: uncharacterized protein LOC105451278 [Wasmannia auropunctata]
MYPADTNVNRMSQYPHYSRVLNLDGIEFPMSLNKIGQFERQNNLSINVFTIKEENYIGANYILPLRLTAHKKEVHVNLLLIYGIRCGKKVMHFTWIKNLSRLISTQLSKRKAKKYVCDRCLHYFYSQRKLANHIIDCESRNECAVVLPSDKDKWLFFRNHQNKERLPFVVYADLECILEKKDNEEEREMDIDREGEEEEEDDNDEERRDDIPRRRAYQHHRAFSVGYYVCGAYNYTSTYKYRNHQNKKRLPFVIYADLECILEKKDNEEEREMDIDREGEEEEEDDNDAVRIVLHGSSMSCMNWLNL